MPVVAVSKGPDRNAGRETFHLPGGRELTLPPNSALLFYLQRLRDEAHRFAIGTHRAEAGEEPDHLEPRRGSRHRPEPEARAADAFRDGAGGQGSGARGPRAGARHLQGDGAPGLRPFPPARLTRCRSRPQAIVCALRGHGEHGGIVRLFTPDDGLIAAYVRGARSRRMRPVLIAGNLVHAQLRSRTEAQLPQATIELAHSRAAVLAEPLPAAAIEWAAALVATALPERQPYPRSTRRSPASSTPSKRRHRPRAGRRRWSASNCCCSASSASASTSIHASVSGADDELVAVSPRSGRAQ